MRKQLRVLISLNLFFFILGTSAFWLVSGLSSQEINEAVLQAELWLDGTAYLNSETELYVWLFILLIILVPYISGLILMFFSYSVGRVFFVLAIVLQLPVLLLLGHTVFSPLEQIFGGLEAMTAGAIIFAVYFSPIREIFHKSS